MRTHLWKIKRIGFGCEKTHLVSTPYLQSIGWSIWDFTLAIHRVHSNCHPYGPKEGETNKKPYLTFRPSTGKKEKKKNERNLDETS